MGRDARGLPSGWDTPIPDAIWPEAMLSAIRHDVSALSSARVITTIQLWRERAVDDQNPEHQAEAKRLLGSLGRALLPPSLDDVFDADSVTTAVPPAVDSEGSSGDAHTVDTFQLPPKPTGLRREGSRAVVAPNFDTPKTIFADDAIVEVIDSDTDSRIPQHAPERAPPTGSSAPPTDGFTEEDEKPTTAFIRPDTNALPPARPPIREASVSGPLDVAAPVPARPPPIPDDADDSIVPSERLGSTDTELPKIPRLPTPFDEDDKPTRHIDLPEAKRRLDSLDGPEQTEMAARPPSKPMPAADSRALAEDLDDDVDVDLEATLGLNEEEAQKFRVHPSRSAPPAEANEPELRGPSRLAPKPGIIRRRSTRGRRGASTPKPRAAMHHVRSLYGLLVPFAAELIPLPFERRSRRFWARWREVAGDRGVRREFVEDLLQRANDTRTIVCELISEVQSVDVKSVYQLVDKMDGAGEVGDNAARPGAPDRTRGPLVGASVRVEGVLVDED